MLAPERRFQPASSPEIVGESPRDGLLDTTGAAALWARARPAERPSAAADAHDADVLVAQQAISDGAVVVTGNKRHFEAFVAVMTLDEVPLGDERA